MPNALFSFDARANGQRAADRLTQEGVSPEAFEIHTRRSGPNDDLTAEADELATGGFIRNLLDMFQGMLEWGSSPHDASSYAETVRRGGAVISVDAPTESEMTKVDRIMQTTGWSQRTEWSDAPSSSPRKEIP